MITFWFGWTHWWLSWNLLWGLILDTWYLILTVEADVDFSRDGWSPICVWRLHSYFCICNCTLNIFFKVWGWGADKWQKPNIIFGIFPLCSHFLPSYQKSHLACELGTQVLPCQTVISHCVGHLKVLLCWSPDFCLLVTWASKYIYFLQSTLHCLCCTTVTPSSSSSSLPS